MKSPHRANVFSIAGKLVLGLLLLAGAASVSRAQSASGLISRVSGTYNYSMVISNAVGASGDIGSFWFGWIPGENYLLSTPTGFGLPTGWTDSPQGSAGAASVQFVASSSSDYIAPGQFMTFTFSSADSPSVLGGNTTAFSDHNPITTSVAYTAGLFSSGGDQFAVAVQSVPEPSSWALVAIGLVLVAVGQRVWKTKTA